jgi:hypothetical protein
LPLEVAAQLALQPPLPVLRQTEAAVPQALA